MYLTTFSLYRMTKVEYVVNPELVEEFRLVMMFKAVCDFACPKSVKLQVCLISFYSKFCLVNRIVFQIL